MDKRVFLSRTTGCLLAKLDCGECGWRECLVLKAINKLLSVKDVEIIAEAVDSKNQW